VTGAGDRTRNLLLVAASVLVTLICLEVASRIWVTVRGNQGVREVLIAPVTAKAGFIYAAETGYRLEPNVRWRDAENREFTHNHLGFRSQRELASPKPAGVVRVVLMGASTVYGIYVSDTETSAAQLEAWLARRHLETRFEVINAGVPGWTTRETLINFERRVLALEPDVVVVADGRNDIFPELFDNYRDDYSHYRRIGYDFRHGNRLHKAIFRVSYFGMLMTTARGYRFGYSPVNEHPAYGYVRWENKPDLAGVLRNGHDIDRTRGFRNNLRALVARARARGIVLALASLPFVPERFRSGVMPEPDVLPVLERFAQANTRITREVAREHALPFADGARLNAAELLFDDCHFTPLGETAFATLMGLAVESTVAGRPQVSRTDHVGSGYTSSLTNSHVGGQEVPA
jgi:lysophospholipase L1-like esterase